MKNEKGVTLVSLVITIIVLLVLATVSIYAGTGTIRYANYNKAKAEMQTISTQVNSWNEEYLKVDVKDEEIEEGQTREQVKATKQQAIIEKYGVLTTDSSCDQTILNTTIQATGITATDYRFLSEEYLKQNLGLDASFEYLINIISKDVILLGGISYNGQTYYTLNDFEITNVESNLPSSISFNVVQGENTDVIISDVKLKTSSEDVGTDFSKFLVQYKKTTDENWNDVTASVIKFTDNNQTKFKFPIPEEKTKTENYDIKISTVDKLVSNTVQVAVNFPYVLATFDANGGTISTENTNSKLVKIGDEYGELPIPTRDEYTFKGWNGKNMFDKDSIDDTHFIVTATGEVSGLTGSNRLDDWASSDIIKVKPNTTYIKSGTIDAKTQNYFDVDSNLIKVTNIASGESFTTPNNCYYVKFNLKRTNSPYANIQLEEGSEATEYEPYYITSSTTVVQSKDHTLTAIWQENN